MKNRKLIHPATFFFLLTLSAVFLSWVGSIYGWSGVANLLSAEGLRWMLRYTEIVYVQSPVLAVALILFLGGGLFVHSGLRDTCRRLWVRKNKFTHREARALFLTSAFGGVYYLLWGILAWGPWNIVRSAINTLSGSPLADGLLGVFSLGIGGMAVVYGYVSGRYRTDKDVVAGMAFLFRRFADYFVTLFFVVQFFAVLSYTRLLICAGLTDIQVDCLYISCCVLPLFYRK